MGTQRGFTIVEIAITLAIMAILLALGLSAYSESQVNARDAERRGDVENIALALERFYTSGSTEIDPTTLSPYKPGRYPSVQVAQSSNFLSAILPGLDVASRTYSFSNPSPADHFQVDYSPSNPNENAESGAPISRITSNATVHHIVYQPLTYNTSISSWVACQNSGECTRYKLYYVTEKQINGTTLQIKESKKQ